MGVVFSLPAASCYMGAPVNQVFHGVSCLLGSSQSAVHVIIQYFTISYLDKST